MSKKQRVVFKFEPLSASDLLRLANEGSPIPSERVLATFGEPENWIQIYHGETSRSDYQAKACEWAFIGPVRPPYELAQHGIGNTFTLEQVMEALREAQSHQPQTGRDNDLSKRLKDTLKDLAHRTRADSSAGSECETRVASDEANGG